MRKPARKAAASKKSKRVASAKAPDGDRQRRIAELAYAIGARRGFAGGTDEAREDWLEAERMVDRDAGKPS